jgi:hypothetical protein
MEQFEKNFVGPITNIPKLVPMNVTSNEPINTFFPSLKDQISGQTAHGLTNAIAISPDPRRVGITNASPKSAQRKGSTFPKDKALCVPGKRVSTNPAINVPDKDTFPLAKRARQTA